MIATCNMQLQLAMCVVIVISLFICITFIVVWFLFHDDYDNNSHIYKTITSSEEMATYMPTETIHLLQGSKFTTGYLRFKHGNLRFTTGYPSLHALLIINNDNTVVFIRMRPDYVFCAYSYDKCKIIQQELWAKFICWDTNGCEFEALRYIPLDIFVSNDNNYAIEQFNETICRPENAHMFAL